GAGEDLRSGRRRHRELVRLRARAAVPALVGELHRPGKYLHHGSGHDAGAGLGYGAVRRRLFRVRLWLCPLHDSQRAPCRYPEPEILARRRLLWVVAVYFAHPFRAARLSADARVAVSGRRVRSREPARRHGDQLERLPNGYYRAHGRVDDTMNLNGIKVSSTEIEQVVNTVEQVCETAAIAVSPAAGGPSQLIIYAVLSPDAQKTKAELITAMQTAIKQHLNPLFKVHDLVIVDALPRTASNKVMRRILRDSFNEVKKEGNGR
ncbi:MAG: hypothetical protein K6T90_21180, partial [Leptolyngbyaceae cyanobacterium HOT.MB2.61]|nr:hypothetical protein [Leptolyngbyaceae cyanobacterium HOT.MB2.61]